MLKGILKKSAGIELDWSGSGQRQLEGCYEQDN